MRCFHYDCAGWLIRSVSVVLQPARPKSVKGQVVTISNWYIIVIYEKSMQSLFMTLPPFCLCILGLCVDMILRRNIQSCQHQSNSNKNCRKVLLLAPVSPTFDDLLYKFGTAIHPFVAKISCWTANCIDYSLISHYSAYNAYNMNWARIIFTQSILLQLSLVAIFLRMIKHWCTMTSIIMM